MPPVLAFFLTAVFVAFLFRRDLKERPNVTGALWLPVIWLMLNGSRSVVNWLTLTGHVKALSVEEGNPIDAFVYLVLIVAAFYVLSRREVNLSQVLQHNGWLVAFLVYCFLAIIWSDFPLVAFKRWIKILGHPLMALIVLTEPDPEEAFARLIKRCAYVLAPVSILFIKYFPEWGRTFDQWTGLATNTGITKGKNALGCDCLILGFFLFWLGMKAWQSERGRERRRELILIGGLLLMIVYLFRKAHSATAFLSLLIGILIVVVLGWRVVNKRVIGMYVVVGVITLIVAEVAFGFVGYLIELTQHDTTLAGREALWHELVALDTNPIFGVGFESFWLGKRLDTIQAAHWWHPTEAHNGYLETYLDLGVVGLFMLAGVLISTYFKARRELLKNFNWGRFRMGFLAAVILYNWTEATFKGLNALWFAFYIIALEYPNPYFEQRLATQNLALSEAEEEGDPIPTSSGYRRY